MNMRANMEGFDQTPDAGGKLRDKSFQADAIVRVPGGSVGKNDAIARRQAADDFNEADRAAAELHLRAVGIHAVGVDLENADRGALLPEGGASDVEHVVEALEF